MEQVSVWAIQNLQGKMTEEESVYCVRQGYRHMNRRAQTAQVDEDPEVRHRHP